MKFAHEVTIPAAADAINLPNWLFGLSEEDYAATVRAPAWSTSSRSADR